VRGSEPNRHSDAGRAAWASSRPAAAAGVKLRTGRAALAAALLGSLPADRARLATMLPAPPPQSAEGETAKAAVDAPNARQAAADVR
jgi:hypothetical protein